MEIPLHIARIICGMDSICEGEGIGPDSRELMSWIRDNYPELKEEFPYLESLKPEGCPYFGDTERAV